MIKVDISPLILFIFYILKYQIFYNLVYYKFFTIIFRVTELKKKAVVILQLGLLTNRFKSIFFFL